MDDKGPHPRLVAIDVADDPEAWASAGFTVAKDRVTLGDTTVHLTGRRDGAKGITGWHLAGVPLEAGDLDGLPTFAVDHPTDRPADTDAAAAHPNGVIGLDHVVVLTPDLDRTIAALEAVGLGLRRIRDTNSYGAPMRQAFFRLGRTVLEVVGGEDGSGRPAADDPARWFGLAVDVDDLDATGALLGAGLGHVKAAVQEGRRIATLRHKDLGMSVAIAAMDHHGDRPPFGPGQAPADPSAPDSTDAPHH